MFRTIASRIAVSALLLAPAIALPALAHAASQYVVISAEPPSDAFPAGKVLKVNDTIEVPEGAVVTLLGEDGSVNPIQGPASVTVTEEQLSRGAAEEEKARSVFSRVADLLSGSKAGADSLGVARSMGDGGKAKGLDDPWVVSIHESGQACVRGNEVVLARASDVAEVPLAVEADQDLKLTGEVWAKGESVFALPAPIAEKANELFIRAGGTQNFVQLNRIPADVDQEKPLDVLGWMLDNNCRTQTIAFTRALANLSR
jgi:hypothetical protein